MDRLFKAAVAIIVLLCGGLALAQPVPRFPGTGCRTVKVNLLGVSNADITIDNSAGGVTIMNASTSRCAAVIKNTGTAGMRCAPTSISVSTTAGQDLQASESFSLGLEGQEAWKCIRETVTSTTANVSESYP